MFPSSIFTPSGQILSNPRSWLETCPIERTQQPHANRRSLHLATELLSLLWDGPISHLQIWYSIRYLSDYRMLLYHGRALQATHMLPYSGTPYAVFSVHGGSYLSTSVQDQTDIPLSGEFIRRCSVRYVCVVSLNSVICLWVCFRATFSQPAKINKNQYNHEQMHQTINNIYYRSNLEPNKTQSSQEENKEKEKEKLNQSQLPGSDLETIPARG